MKNKNEQTKGVLPWYSEVSQQCDYGTPACPHLLQMPSKILLHNRTVIESKGHQCRYNSSHCIAGEPHF